MVAMAAPAWAKPARPVVMLDPGHGGTNRGAHGKAIRTYEKHLTLKICKLAATALKKMRPRWRVLLTRKDDRYLTLNQRVRVANKAGADLFISVHLNASPAASQHGFETFILSKDASDKEAARLAAAENAEPTPEKPGEAGVVAQILGDLRQTAAHAGSLRLARLLQREMSVVRGPTLDRGVKQAPFDVLLGLKMPGALLETGFIDHDEEGAQMATAAVQLGIARAVALAVIAYLEEKPAGTTKKAP